MKVQNPIIGRARGSAGGMTFCKNYDKNVARAKAFEVSNPNTQAQQTQRAFFAELTALCSDFSEDQLRFLFPSKPKTMSRRNALSKQIAQSYAINGTEKTIDYADIDTLGNAPVMDFGEFGVANFQDYFTFSLETFAEHYQEYTDNVFVVLFINTTKKEILFPSSAQTVGGMDLNVPYPNGWQSNHTILGIPFLTNFKGQADQFPGFGATFAIKRPPRKND